MKILMVSDVYFPRINGVSTSIQTFKQELENLGHHVSLIVPEYPQEYNNNERQVYRIPSRRVLMDPEDRMLKMQHAMKHLDQFKQQGFDLVHIHTPFVAHYLGLKLAKQLNIPAVVSYHTFFEEYLFHYLPFLPKEFTRYIARRFSCSQCNQADAIVVPSTAMRSVLEKYGVKQRMEIIPTGIGASQTTRQIDSTEINQFKQQLGIAAERPCLVHVGRIAFEKNIDFLLQVIQRVTQTISDLAVIMAGEGPALADIKTRVKELGLHDTVYFTGYLDRRTELPLCYASGDAFIFASRTETQGLVLLEAMALGVPVVSTAVMGTRDILQPQQGALVAEEAVDDFAAKVIQILHDKTLRLMLSREARNYVKKWTSTEMAGRMLGFYESVLADTDPSVIFESEPGH